MQSVKPNWNEKLCVVLVRPRNPLNIGAVARAMANFGCSQLRLVEPYDVAFREARSAVGATDILTAAQVYPSVAEAIADRTLVVGTTAATNRSPKEPLLPLPAAAPFIVTALQAGRVALLFGSEKRGLANDDLSHCHRLLRIPTTAESPSMNLAQSVVVVLYELARTGSVPQQGGHPGNVPEETVNSATAQTMQRLAELLHESLLRSGYYSQASQASSGEQLRRLLRRLHLREPDAEILLGMLRQILWKLHT